MFNPTLELGLSWDWAGIGGVNDAYRVALSAFSRCETLAAAVPPSPRAAAQTPPLPPPQPIAFPLFPLENPNRPPQPLPSTALSKSPATHPSSSTAALITPRVVAGIYIHRRLLSSRRQVRRRDRSECRCALVASSSLPQITTTLFHWVVYFGSDLTGSVGPDPDSDPICIVPNFDSAIRWCMADPNAEDNDLVLDPETDIVDLQLSPWFNYLPFESVPEYVERVTHQIVDSVESRLGISSWHQRFHPDTPLHPNYVTLGELLPLRFGLITPPPEDPPVEPVQPDEGNLAQESQATREILNDNNERLARLEETRVATPPPHDQGFGPIVPPPQGQGYGHFVHRPPHQPVPDPDT
uniref:Uncharacterized protein n=1 Tax=Asparagus officinalis TaxID=4686 RepID=Q2AA97_ASPOF|nr:hypothetical protein 17.t00024 [Asparagus officinalis]